MSRAKLPESSEEAISELDTDNRPGRILVLEPCTWITILLEIIIRILYSRLHSVGNEIN